MVRILFRRHQVRCFYETAGESPGRGRFTQEFKFEVARQTAKHLGAEGTNSQFSAGLVDPLKVIRDREARPRKHHKT